MLEYFGIEVCKGIYVNITDGLTECIFCHCWYFLEINFRFQPEVSDDCYDLMQKAMSFNVELFLLQKWLQGSHLFYFCI